MFQLNFFIVVNLTVVFVVFLHTAKCKTQDSSKIWKPIVDVEPGKLLTPAQGCGQIRDTQTKQARKITKKELKQGIFHWMALIGVRRDKNNEDIYEIICDGSVITTKHILAVAHCTASRSKSKDLFVKLGAYSLFTKADGSIVHETEVISINIHENYTSSPLYLNDIAILTLKEDITFSDRINAICLPIPNQTRYPKLRPGRKAFVAGWRRTFDIENDSHTLLSTKLRLMKSAKCTKDFDQFDEVKEICAKNSSNEPCDYDAGGPLMLKINGSIYNYGLASATQQFCVSGPNRFMKIPYYMEWIQSKLN